MWKEKIKQRLDSYYIKYIGEEAAALDEFIAQQKIKCHTSRHYIKNKYCKWFLYNIALCMILPFGLAMLFSGKFYLTIDAKKSLLVFCYTLIASCHYAFVSCKISINEMHHDTGLKSSLSWFFAIAFMAIWSAYDIISADARIFIVDTVGRGTIWIVIFIISILLSSTLLWDSIVDDFISYANSKINKRNEDSEAIASNISAEGMKYTDELERRLR